jgi:hypothetical protein
MDDNFWNEIDAMMGTPFATDAAQQMPLQVEDVPNIMDAPLELPPVLPAPPAMPPITPTPPAPFPFPVPVVAPVQAVANLDTSLSIQVDTLRTDLRALVNKCGTRVSYARFKREANRAWLRKYPGSKPPMNAFQAFIKENIKTVRNENPMAGHGEHMKIIGRLWRERGRGRGR